MATRTFPLTVGTSAVLALIGNQARVGWRVTYPATGIVAANTGRLHVGRGFQPSTDLASPIIGDMLQNGGELAEARQFKEEKIWQGDVWLIDTVAAQTIIVEEELELQGAYG
jgi:hypothetical protein